jgi:hypothetical protein
MRSFETWEFEQVNDAFGMTQIWEHPLLDRWLKAEFEINPHKLEMLEDLRIEALRQVTTWNEDELKFLVISPLMNLVKFGGADKEYKVFTQRRLSATVNDIEISGLVDCMVSTGKQNPKHPFFFVHEYKQERKRENDPLGQLLVEMIAAQAKNETKHPIYGVYVTGRFWFFTIVTGNQYVVNYALDITRKDDTLLIFKMLLFVKQEIEAYFNR